MTCLLARNALAVPILRTSDDLRRWYLDPHLTYPLLEKCKALYKTFDIAALPAHDDTQRETNKPEADKPDEKHEVRRKTHPEEVGARRDDSWKSGANHQQERDHHPEEGIPEKKPSVSDESKHLYQKDGEENNRYDA